MGGMEESPGKGGLLHGGGGAGHQGVRELTQGLTCGLCESSHEDDACTRARPKSPCTQPPRKCACRASEHSHKDPQPCLHTSTGAVTPPQSTDHDMGTLMYTHTHAHPPLQRQLQASPLPPSQQGEHAVHVCAHTAHTQHHPSMQSLSPT